MKPWILLIALGVVASGAHAADCAAISTAIQDNLKAAAAADARTSVPKHDTSYFAQVAGFITQAQINLSLLIASKCDIPETPLQFQIYSTAAYTCALDVERNLLESKSGSPPSCDRSKWQPKQ